MTVDHPSYQHPKCYANLHGGCSTKISGEHYFSHSMIKLYTFDDPEIKIMLNHGFGIPKRVSPKNFVVNALCVNHNTALSGADAAALQFATFVRRVYWSERNALTRFVFRQRPRFMNQPSIALHAFA